jgi:hypothetical protein
MQYGLYLSKDFNFASDFLKLAHKKDVDRQTQTEKN